MKIRKNISWVKLVQKDIVKPKSLRIGKSKNPATLRKAAGFDFLTVPYFQREIRGVEYKEAVASLYSTPPILKTLQIYRILLLF
jgi:hypothetical protein